MLEQEGYDLISAAIEVYNEMKSGYLEGIYQECLQHELTLRGIPFESQPAVTVYYKGRQLEQSYRPDLLVFGEIIAELKALKAMGNNEYCQLFNYLKITRKRVGYLLNFGSPGRLEWKRFVL